MYKDELLLKNVFVQILYFVPFNHNGHRSSDCKQSTLLAVDMPSTRKKKLLGPYKEKLKEELSCGNSIAFVLFLFFLSLFFGSPNIVFVCFCFKRLECFLFD